MNHLLPIGAVRAGVVGGPAHYPVNFSNPLFVVFLTLDGRGGEERCDREGEALEVDSVCKILAGHDAGGGEGDCGVRIRARVLAL